MIKWETVESKKRNYHIEWVVLFLLAIVLFATNPTEAQFKQHIKDVLKAEAKTEGVLAGAIGELIAGPTVYLSTTVRTNYYLLSVYEITILGQKRVYFGIFNHFIGSKTY